MGKSPGRPGACRYIIAKGASGCGSASYGLYTGPTAGLAFYISNGATSASTDYIVSPDAGGGVWDGNWHRVVGTFDGRTLRLYVDGVEIGSGTRFSGPIAYARTSGTDLYIGYYPAPQGCSAGGFTGSIDEPTVWNFVLDAVQVGQLEPAGEAPSRAVAPPTPTQPPSTMISRNRTGTVSVTRHTLPPVLRHLRVSPSILPRTHGHHARGRRVRAMTISYTDTRAGASGFSVLLPQAGFRQGGKCVVVPVGQRVRRAQRCTRYRVVGKFAHADRAGGNHFAFTAVMILQLVPHLCA